MSSIKQRADIEGLRGIAVLAVVFFHSGLKFAAGGYIGVDVFFVISGYLISKSIIDSFDNQGFSLLKFYERRFRRIIPTAIAVIIITGALGLICLLPEELIELATSIHSALLLRSNILAANSIDYFGIATEFKPLIHFWSLSIELQFYLLFPILLSFFLYFNMRKLFSTSVFIMIIALLFFTTLYISNNPAKYYFSSIMRAWELLLGAMLCLSNIDDFVASKNLAIINYLPALGLLLIFISFCIVNQASHFPGSLALLPCAGGALILLVDSSRTSSLFSNSILSNRLLRAIGVISFSLYLVHQPIFAYFRILNGRKSSDLESMILIGISIIFSIIVYILIERPSQSTNKKSRATLYFFTISSWFLILIFACQTQNKELPQFNLESNVAKFLNFRYDNNPRLDECRTDQRIIDPTKACLYGDKNLPGIAIWGDSHVDQIVAALADEFNKYGYSIKEFSIAGCPPLLDIEPIGVNRNCSKNAEIILSYLIDNKKIQHVFLYAYWIGYIDDGLIMPNASEANRMKSIKNSFETLVSTLTRSGKTVHLIYPVPKMKVDPPLYLARLALMYPGKKLPYIKISNTDYLNQAKRSINLLDEISREFQLNTIQPVKALYDAKSFSFYANNFENVYYRDDNHLSLTGGFKVAALIAQQAFSTSHRLTQRTAPHFSLED